MKWKLSVVKTPQDVPNGADQLTLPAVQNLLNEELTESWTEMCTEIVRKSTTTLFLYDRMEFCLSRAYGANFKILLNPMMVMCYHPTCLQAYRSKKKKPWNLKQILDISCYLKHLKDHSDAFGTAMQHRFNAIAENHFMTTEQLDSISPSPHSLTNITEFSNEYVNMFGIDRKLQVNYICHWKDKLVQSEVIKPNSLSFQEDDAMVYSILKYPNPVRNWAVWSTINFYSMKLYTAISASALSLYRGVTKLRSTGHSENDVHSFASSINHPAPSVSTMQRQFPVLKYENEQFHKSEVLFHLKVLAKNDESIAISFQSVTRYLVTLGIDDQEINQGVFVHDGHLYGLCKKNSAPEIQQIGYENFAKYVAEENRFVSTVREYRLTDFKGKFCSNVYTSFENAISFTGEICNMSLLKVVQLAQKCLQCQLNGYECHYETLDVSCDNCEIRGHHCVSMVVWHVLWDMASAHRKAFRISTNKIDLLSDEADYKKSVMFTIGFGGLHLAKAPINSSRNHVLSYNGQNFGVNILRSYKHESEILGRIKNAVFQGKDRQSDYLAFMTTSLLIQEFLAKQKFYGIVRVPEPILTYTENAKSQKSIVFPTSIVANTNGDVFVLDAASACVHVIDRSIVAKCSIIGTYQKSDESKYKPDSKKNIMLGKDVKLSNQLPCMCIGNDDLYVSDKRRGEIMILLKVVRAKAVFSARLHILTMENCVGMCFVNGGLVVLKQDDNGCNIVMFISFTVPPRKSYTLHLCLVTKSIIPECEMKGVFTVFGSDAYFGGWMKDDAVHFFKQKKKEWVELCTTSYRSSSLPSANSQTLVMVNDSKDEIVVHQLELTKQNVVGSQTRSVKLSNASHFFLWEKVIFLLQKKNVNTFQLEEHGSLDFGLKFCKAMNNFYSAISYIAPNSQRTQNITLDDCITLASDVQSLFNSMQESLEEKNPTRHSFSGPDGSPSTYTITCLDETVNSWISLLKRLDHFQKGLGKSVYPHAITNESMVEHSFGFTKKRGQGHLLSMEEYIQSKRSQQTDFQLRMCNLPFSQTIKSKIRDKGYQDLQEHGRLDLSLKEMKEIFQSSDDTVVTAEIEITDKEKLVLKRAFFLSKSVPRNSTRTKWRETGNFRPNLLIKTQCHGKLLKGDMVFHLNIENTLVMFMLSEDFSLTETDKNACVTEVGTNKKLDVDVSKLVTDKGLILTVPQELYNLVGDHVVFDDAVDEVLDAVKNKSSNSTCDEDLCLMMDAIPEISSIPDIVRKPEEKRSLSLDEDSGPSGATVPRKAKRMIQSDDEDEDFAPSGSVRKNSLKKLKVQSDDEDDEISFQINGKSGIRKGEWVIVCYDDVPYIGTVDDIDAKGFKVNTLNNCGSSNSFKWTAESIWYNKIMTTINEPKPSNNRGFLKLSDKDYAKFKNFFG